MSILEPVQAIRVLAAAMLLWLAAPCLASPRLSADPADASPPAAAEPGYIDLGSGAVAYLPARVSRDRPAPLLVLLHGSGGDAKGFVRRMEREAKAFGIVIVGIKSRGRSWDLLLTKVPREPLASRIDGRPAPFRIDPRRIDQTLRALFARVPVDPQQIGLAGFSDGASYALSIGTANPQLFSTVLSFSPGLADLPRIVAPGQRVFVAHGDFDRKLPYNNVRLGIVPMLRSRKLDVTFRSFHGAHILPREVTMEGVAFFVNG